MDAPLIVGKDGVANRSLEVLASGASEAYEEVRPLLDTFGDTVVYTGELGTGTVIKLCPYPNCGKPVPSNMRFCQFCGASLPGQQMPPVPTAPYYQPPYQSTPAKSNTTLMIAIVVIVIVVVTVIGGVLAVGFFSALSRRRLSIQETSLMAS